MPVKSHIEDIKSKRTLPVVEAKNALDSGIIAYVEDARTFTPRFKPFINDTYGNDMTQDFTTGSGGTSNVVFSNGSITSTSFSLGQVTITSANHGLSNGTSVTIDGTTSYDGSYGVTNVATNTFEITAGSGTDPETGTWAGGWVQTFSAGTWSNTGSLLNLTDGNNNDIATLTNDSDLDVSSYDQITGSITLSQYNANQNNLLFKFTDSSDVLIGNEINFDDYVNPVVTTAQTFTIPKGDMELGTRTNIRKAVLTVERAGGPRPDLTIAQILFEGTAVGSAGVQTYSVDPTPNTIFYATELRIQFTNNVTSTVTNGTVAGIDYSTLLGVTATNGLNFIFERNDINVFSAISKTTSDLIYSGSTISDVISDGTNTTIIFSTIFAHPAELDSRNGDNIRVVLSDDFSSFLEMRMGLKGKEERILFDKNIPYTAV